MANGDVVLMDPTALGTIGAVQHNVATTVAGASIAAGELVLKVRGSNVVVAWPDSTATKPLVGTDFLAGLATTASNETASAAGTVSCLPLIPGTIYLADANSAAAVDTQAEYNALIGFNVLLDSSATGVQTVLTTSAATNGLIIEKIDIRDYPGKIAFSLRQALDYKS